jgi:hypothetical protein
MLNWPPLTIAILLFATSLVSAEPACLPDSIFVANFIAQFPVTDLGYVDNVLTMCVYERAEDPYVDKLIGWWTVNATTGALGASAVRAIPGHGRRTALDANSCIDGYCAAPFPENPDVVKTFFRYQHRRDPRRDPDPEPPLRVRHQHQGQTHRNRVE